MSDIDKYYSGELISESFVYSLNRKDIQCNISRIDFLLNKASKRKIIHIGFCDHIHLIEDRIEKGKWLHANLCKVAQQCVGIDINNSAVEFVKSLGYSDVYCIDISVPPINENVLTSFEPFDYAFIPEVLEHLQNPGEFMENLRVNYGAYFNKLIITVPNAFSVGNFINALKRKEITNTDHRTLFSPWTLSKCIYSSGYKITHLFFCSSNKKSKILSLKFIPRLLINLFFRIFPMLRGTIICECVQADKS